MIYLPCAEHRADILQPAPGQAGGMSLMTVVPCHASRYGTRDGPPCGPAVDGYTMFWRGNAGFSQPLGWAVHCGPYRTLENEI